MTTKFLESALSKNRNRPQYTETHGNLATDGYRLHRDNSLPAVDDYVTKAVENCGLIPAKPRNRATVSRVDLITACKRAFAMRDEWERSKKWYPVITFCMNGSLWYSASSESTGTTRGEIIDGTKVNDKVKAIKNGLKYESHTMVYKHHHEETVSFALNPRQLMDALEGMETETVEIDIPHPLAPFYMTDGTREAVIMPIKITIS